MKINRAYQVLVIIIALCCIAVGTLESSGLLLALGGVLLVGAVGTFINTSTGKHNIASKLPKDIT